MGRETADHNLRGLTLNRDVAVHNKSGGVAAYQRGSVQEVSMNDIPQTRIPLDVGQQGPPPSDAYATLRGIADDADDVVRTLDLLRKQYESTEWRRPNAIFLALEQAAAAAHDLAAAVHAAAVDIAEPPVKQSGRRACGDQKGTKMRFARTVLNDSERIVLPATVALSQLERVEKQR